ncbi:MAG: response regulator [Melioribacteraceae bacterium]|nr:response regulator [Melioribacteraceae bacterium]
MEQKTILVIEDDINIRSNIIEILEQENYKVIDCPDGECGIEKAKEFLPDLIISDIRMPGISGYDVLRELSKDKETRTIPFIFLTAMVDRSDFRLGMELGADDYIFKPFKMQELLSAVKTRINKHNVIIEDNINKLKLSERDSDLYVPEDKFFISVNGRQTFITIQDIVYIKAENQYTNIRIATGKSFIIRRAINTWEEQLPEKLFLRIHRGTIINMNHINKIEKLSGGRMSIHLQAVDEEFIISKRYASKIKKDKN